MKRTAHTIMIAAVIIACIASLVSCHEKDNYRLCVEITEFAMPAEGGDIEIPLETSVPLECIVDRACVEWIETSATISPDTKLLHVAVKANMRFDERTGYLWIESERESIKITIVQDARIYDESWDDGYVKTWQRTDNGAGINFVLMGDGYTRSMIEDETYSSRMEAGVEAIFAKEPLNSLRSLCNVYSVVVESASSKIDGNTALEGYFTGDRMCGGNDKACMEYAMKAIGEEQLDQTVIIVLMNSDKYAGTAYFYYPSDNAPYSDSAEGLSIAFFAMHGNDLEFIETLQHEACGHGLAKLADEYSADGAPGSEDESKYFPYFEYIGWYRNVSLESDPQKVKWSKFINDDRYAAENIGVYEGAVYNAKGFYRPTENSLMRALYSDYNAPSREAIYYRINKLYYGRSWKYDYEEFVQQDLPNIHPIKSMATIPGKHAAELSDMEKIVAEHEHHGPFIVGMSASEALRR